VYTYLAKRLQTVTTLMSLLPEYGAFWRPFWRSMTSIFVPRNVYNVIHNTYANKNGDYVIGCHHSWRHCVAVI